MLRLLRDTRYALRSLQNSRGFTTVAILTIASTIAAVTLVFSVINATLLRSLPYSKADDLLILHSQDQYSHPRIDVSAPVFWMVEKHATSLESVAAIYVTNMGVNLAGVSHPDYVKALRVSQKFFRTLGVKPSLGRDFLPEEDLPGAQHVVILSYGLWERNFNRDPEVLGRTIRINSESYMIVGVTGKGFRSYPEAEVWLPLQLSQATAAPGNDYRVIARLKDGFTREMAGQELESLSRKFPLPYLLDSSDRGGTVVAEGLQHFLTGDIKTSLMVLFAAVLFVLLIACTNLAILLLVRVLGRTQEIAVRFALGSNRRHLVQMFLTESFVLAVSGGLLGLIAAKEAMPVIVRYVPTGLRLAAEIKIDMRVACFTLVMSALITLLFGFSPALKVSFLNLNQMLQRGSRGSTASVEQMRLGNVLICAQTALTLILLAGTALLLKSFLKLQAVPAGFEPKPVSVAQISLASAKYEKSAATAQLLERILSQLRNRPGIEAVASISGLPLEKGLNLPLYATASPTQIEHAGEYRIVSEGYFRSMQIPIRAGRAIAITDAGSTTPVAVINETLAHRWWPNSSPIGQFIKVGDELGQQLADAPRQIIGVAADVHDATLDRSPGAMIYVPVEQVPDNITAFANRLFLTSIVIRTRGQEKASVRVSDAVYASDPDLPLASLRPLTDVVQGSLALPRFYASLTAAFSIFALLLTAIGLYGLLSYYVTLRTREIGLRMAVGAKRSEVGALFIRHGVTLVAVGAVPGIIGALFFNRLLGSMFYNPDGTSWGILGSATILLGIVAASVGMVTAVRAASIDPMVVLRSESW